MSTFKEILRWIGMILAVLFMLTMCAYDGGNRHRHSLPDGMAEGKVKRMCQEQFGVSSYVVYDSVIFCTRNHYALDGAKYKLNVKE